MLGHPDHDRRQLGELTREGSAASTRSASANSCAHDPHRPGQCSTISSTCSGGSSRRFLPSCPCCPPRLRPDPFPPGRGDTDGGSCDGGNDNSANSDSADARARPPEPRGAHSHRPAADSPRPTRLVEAATRSAVSRSPPRIASASTRSTPHDSPPANGSLPRLNAYLLCCRSLQRPTGIGLARVLARPWERGFVCVRSQCWPHLGSAGVRASIRCTAWGSVL